jgi:ABC-type antimicrobial peptide transport system permease subunit
MILKESILLVTIGIFIGVAAATATSRFLASLLFGLAPTDAFTVTGAVLIMVTVSLLAAYLPSRQASRVDPLACLHYE